MKIHKNKALGQHFFNNSSLAEQIVKNLPKNSSMNVLEIGPGYGVFTKFIHANGYNITAIEKDELLYRELIRKEDERFRIINADFLDIDLDKLRLPADTICYGSLPYNVSKRIIEKCMLFGFDSMHFIIQKEVADSYISVTPQLTRLSLLRSLFYNAKIEEHIKPGSFYPPPKVQSSLIAFRKLDNPLLDRSEYSTFRGFANKCFTNPRKKIHNNLSGDESKHIEASLRDKRPAELTVHEFLAIFNAYRSAIE